MRTAFANAVRTVATVFVGDPVAEPQLAAIDRQDTLNMRGYGARLQLGDKGDPKFSFGGAVPYPVEMITAGPSATTPIKDPNGGMLASAGPDTANLIDPPMRIFADRMRRGQS